MRSFSPAALAIAAAIALSGFQKADAYENEIKRMPRDERPPVFSKELPHTYIEVSDMPKSFTWGNVGEAFKLSRG